MAGNCSVGEGTHVEGDKRQSKLLLEAVNQLGDLLTGFDLSCVFQTCLYYASRTRLSRRQANHLFVSQVPRGAQEKHFSYRARKESEWLNVSFMKLEVNSQLSAGVEI
jgi:hypothetical protein